MNRLNRHFKNASKTSSTTLIPYITAGLPTPESTVELMHEMVNSGANCIELGVPFSDPMADGPVIQKANEKALEQNVTILSVLEMVREFRINDINTPVILMGYLNPIEQLGYELFAELSEEVGVDGLITVDLPPEESTELRNAIKGKSIEIIFLVAPTTTEKRLKYISEISESFIYYVSLKGITGSSNFNKASADQGIARIRQTTSIPIGIGFGIKDEKSAIEAAKTADAIIIGSAIVERIENNAQHSIDNIKEFISRIKKAISVDLQTTTSNVA